MARNLKSVFINYSVTSIQVYQFVTVNITFPADRSIFWIKNHRKQLTCVEVYITPNHLAMRRLAQDRKKRWTETLQSRDWRPKNTEKLFRSISQLVVQILLLLPNITPLNWSELSTLKHQEHNGFYEYSLIQVLAYFL